jgi:hypothetical protein
MQVSSYNNETQRKMVMLFLDIKNKGSKAQSITEEWF